LRGGAGRPDIAGLAASFEQRLVALAADPRKPFWHARLSPQRLADARALLAAVEAAIAPLVALRGRRATLTGLARASVVAFEALGRDEADGLAGLYRGDAGEALAAFLRALVAASADLPVE